MKPKSILIIEDEHALGSALSLLVTRMGHRPQLVGSATAGLEALNGSRFEAAVIDIGLPDESGLKVLEKIRSQGSSMPVLVITAHATLQHAIDSQKQGATAYMNKPLDLEQFKLQLESLLEASKVAKFADEKEAVMEGNLTFIGAAACLRDVFVDIARASAGDFPVLIAGSSGTGKSLAARLIHTHSRFSSGPLTRMECSKLEAWKHEPEWSGGTVVLESLENLNPQAQAELAEQLQQGGGAGIRMIATFKGDPDAAVAEGKLREDLYFTFKPCIVKMPPLRERSSDIPALCHFFAALKQSQGELAEITPAFMSALQAYDWPGNIRELKHVMDYALATSQGGPLYLSHLPESVSAGAADLAADGRLGTELDLAIGRWLDQELGTAEEPSYDQLLQRLETDLLNHLMARFDEKPTRLAEALKLHRGTLRQKLQRIGWQRSKP